MPRCSIVRLAVALVTLAPGCVYPDQLEHIETALDSEGRLHLVTHRVSAEDHGGGHGPRGFHYADQTADGWVTGRIDRLGVVGIWDETTYRLHVTPDDRSILVASGWHGSFALEKGPGEDWAPVPPHVDLGHPDASVDASWVGADGALRVLAGERLLETVDGTWTRATGTGMACEVQDPAWVECHFHPTGDRGGAAALYDPAEGRGALHLVRLACDDAGCAWEPVPDHGLGEPGGQGGNWTNHMFFHTATGTPTVVHGQPFIVRVAADGHERFIGDDVFRFGAAPRPSGGSVVVTSAYYTDALELHLVPEDYALAVTTIPLPTIALEGSTRLSVLIAPGEPEHAHLVLATGSTSIAHLDVALDSGHFEREDFGL